jgi:hypothetical protein
MPIRPRQVAGLFQFLDDRPDRRLLVGGHSAFDPDEIELPSSFSEFLRSEKTVRLQRLLQEGFQLRSESARPRVERIRAGCDGDLVAVPVEYRSPMYGRLGGGYDERVGEEGDGDYPNEQNDESDNEDKDDDADAIFMHSAPLGNYFRANDPKLPISGLLTN